MAGIEDCYTCSSGHTRTLGNFVKATFNALSNTYGFLSPDLWKETKFKKSPLQVSSLLTSVFLLCIFPVSGSVGCVIVVWGATQWPVLLNWFLPCGVCACLVSCGRALLAFCPRSTCLFVQSNTMCPLQEYTDLLAKPYVAEKKPAAAAY